LQKFEHCNGEDSIKLHNYLKQFKLNIRYLGINPNSNRVVVVLVSFFIGKLGDWAFDHNTEIYGMKTMNILINYVRVRFSIEDIEGNNLY
jgi:hypothetical protein